MSLDKRPHILGDHIEIDGERYVLLDATPEQVLRWLHKHYRIAAFGAIRRAAAVARAQPDYMPYRAYAHGMRMAIRAAIESEKKS